MSGVWYVPGFSVIPSWQTWDLLLIGVCKLWSRIAVPHMVWTGLSGLVCIHKFNHLCQLMLTVYAKTYHLMSKQKWYGSSYDYARLRTDLVHVRIIVRVLCPTWAEWTFSVFQWLVSQSAWSSSVLHHSHTLPLKYGHRLYLVFHSEIFITGLPQIQSYSQTCTENREMHEQVELSPRNYSRRRLPSQITSILVPKV